MTEVHGRVRRAFGDHGAFECVADDVYELVATPFSGRVEVAGADGARHEYTLTVHVPMLGEVVAGDLAPVVEDGWYETFELRVVDADGVVKTDDIGVDVSNDGSEIAVEATFTDVNERRAADDAAAVANFVEGTYAQGVIPGYDYTGPAADLLSRARRTDDSDR